MRELETKFSANKVSQDVTDYVNMRIAATKLSLVEDLSSIFGNGLRMILVIVLGAMAFMILSVAGIIWLGGLIGSMLIATLIVAGIYAIAAVIIYLMRKKFIDMIVPMFSSMFFTPPKLKEDDYDAEYTHVIP